MVQFFLNNSIFFHSRTLECRTKMRISSYICSTCMSVYLRIYVCTCEKVFKSVTGEEVGIANRPTKQSFSVIE